MDDPAATPPDAALVAAVRRGDAAAADALVRRHYRVAFSVALGVLGNSMDAEDACQDGFVRALERIDDCRKPSGFVHWLLSIVRNRARNLRDARRVRRAAPIEDADPGIPDGTAPGAERTELRSKLEAAVGALSPEEREVILLKDLEGWDHRAIAESMGISEGMSRQHAFTGRRTLRRLLGEELKEDYLHGR